MPGKPVRTCRAEVDFLIARVGAEIARSEKILPAITLEEYRETSRIYQAIAKAAR